MELRRLVDPEQLAAVLRAQPLSQLYLLADLEPGLFQHCEFHGWVQGEEVTEVALIYRGLAVPTLLHHQLGGDNSSQALIKALLPRLPARFYAHLSPGLEVLLARRYQFQTPRTFLRLGLEELIPPQESDGARLLTPEDLPAIQALYASSYPQAFFTPGSLALGPYLGIFEREELVAIAGVHAASPSQGVAALGNIATHHARRGRGLASRVTAALCRELQARGMGTIGLNVHRDNAVARRVYRRLGFEPVHQHLELLATAC